MGKEMKEFVKWCRNEGFEWNEDELEFEQTEKCGIRVLARSDIPAETLLVQIPTSAILSVPNSRVYKELCRQSGALALTIAVCFEIMNPPSRWQPYLDILPQMNPHLPASFDALYPLIATPRGQQEDLPTPRPSPPQNKRLKYSQPLMDLQDLQDVKDKDQQQKAALQILKSTSIYKTLIDDVEQIKRDYDEIVRPICLKYKWSMISFEMFRRTLTIVLSRCFNVGGVHGDCMIPIADLFNHSAHEHVHLELSQPISSDSFDSYDSSLLLPQNFDSSDVETVDNDLDDDEEELDETTDEPETEDERDLTEDSGEDLIEQREEQGNEEVIEMTLVKSVVEGKEIYNTYGEKTNGELLLKYGFVLHDNPHDVVGISSELILKVISDHLQLTSDDDDNSGEDVEEERVKDKVCWWASFGRKFLVDEFDTFQFHEDNEDGDDEEEDNQGDAEDEELEYEEVFYISKTETPEALIVPYEMVAFISVLLVDPEFLTAESHRDELEDICQSNAVIETMHDEYRQMLEKILQERIRDYSPTEELECNSVDVRNAMQIQKSEKAILLNTLKQLTLL